MSDGFTDFLDRTQAFYGALAQNNSKDWFEPRKAEWKADIEAPAKLLADLLAEDLSRMTGTPFKPKVFRIHRDVRFSKDKSPYKTNLALLWSPTDPEDQGPVFYLGIEPNRAFVGCGQPGFDKDGLTRYRAMVDTWGDRLAEVIQETGASISSFGPDPLKRVPKPYDQDHPQAELLKRKGLILVADLPDGWRESGEGLVATLIDCFERFLPFRNFLAERL